MKRRTYYHISFGAFLTFMLVLGLSAIMLPKGEALYHLFLAQTLLKEGNMDEAVAQAQEAVRLQPDNVTMVRYLVKIYTRMDMHDDAEKALNELIAASPERPEPYHDLGILRLYHRDIEGARQAARKAISISPDYAGSYHLLGAIALEEKDIETAETHLARAAELDPNNSESDYLLGLIHHQKKDFDRAISELKKVTKLNPDFAPAHAALAMCYFEQKLFVHALAELKTAVDLDPSDYNSMYNVACVYSLQNNPEPAIKWLERALDNGFTDLAHVRGDSDLDNIRDNPKFIELIEEAASYASPEASPNEMMSETRAE